MADVYYGNFAIADRFGSDTKGILVVGDSIAVSAMKYLSTGLRRNVTSIGMLLGGSVIAPLDGNANAYQQPTGTTREGATMSGGVTTSSLSGLSGLAPIWYEWKFNNAATITGTTDWFAGEMLFRVKVPINKELWSDTFAAAQAAGTLRAKIFYYRHATGPTGLCAIAVASDVEYAFAAKTTQTFSANGAAGIQSVDIAFPTQAADTNNPLWVGVSPTSAANRTGTDEVFVCLGVQVYVQGGTGVSLFNIAVGGSTTANWLNGDVVGQDKYFANDAAMNAFVAALGFDSAIVMVGVNGATTFTTAVAKTRLQSLVDKLRTAGCADILICNYYGLRETNATGVTKRVGIFPDTSYGTNFTFAAAGKTITKANAFTSYTWTAGDFFYAKSGTGVTPGLYLINSRDSASQITLDTALAAGNPTDVSGYVALAYGGAVDVWMQEYGVTKMREIVDASPSNTGLIDIRTASGDAHAVNRAYLSDGVHPNSTGDRWLSGLVGAAINEGFPTAEEIAEAVWTTSGRTLTA
jgi:lysophospholipase L1-like esterase